MRRRLLLLTIAALLLIACVAAPLLLRTPRGTPFTDLPSRDPVSIRFHPVDPKWPWGTGVYGVVGDELYWFFRSTPNDRNRGFGTPRFDVAETNVWSFAVLRDGTVDVIGRYEGLFSGAVLISDLRPEADGSLHVAISGFREGVTGEVVRLSRDEGAKRIWSGRLGDWPDVHVVGDEVVVEADYGYLRLSRDGAVREEAASDGDLYHATSCVFEGALWMNIGRRMRRPGDRRGLDLVPGLLPEQHFICASAGSGIAVLLQRKEKFLAARGPDKREGPLVRLDRQYWDLSQQGPVAAAWVHGDENTVLIGDANGFRRLRLPDGLRGFRIPHGTSGDELFLLRHDGYHRVRLR